MVKPLLLVWAKGLYRLECVQTGAVVNQVNGFHLKPFHAGGDAEPQGKLDSAEQKDDFDEDEEGGLDGGKRQGGLDGEEQQDDCNSNEQADGLDGEEYYSLRVIYVHTSTII